MTHIESLRQHAEPARLRIVGSGRPDASKIELLLLISARHVAAARVGLRLYREPEVIVDLGSGAAVQTAALMTLFGCAMTSIDHCASALLRWLGKTPGNGREYDLGEMQKMIVRGVVTVPEVFTSWLDLMDDAYEMPFLTELRHSIIHRVVRESVIVRPGGGHLSSVHPDGEEVSVEQGYLLPRQIAEFAEEAWIEFWQAFASQSAEEE